MKKCARQIPQPGPSFKLWSFKNVFVLVLLVLYSKETRTTEILTHYSCICYENYSVEGKGIVVLKCEKNIVFSVASCALS